MTTSPFQDVDRLRTVQWTDVNGASASPLVEEIVDSLKHSAVLILHRFADVSAISSLKRQALSEITRRVSVAPGDSTWTEHALKLESDLFRLMTSSCIETLVERALGRSIESRVGWVHRYERGEKISWHRDTGGDLQLVCCLETPPPERGGVLMVDIDGVTTPVPLGEGDAMLFDATAVSHGTTPIESANERRIVAVMRFIASRVSDIDVT